MGQIVIKVLLIAAFGALAMLLVFPRPTTRGIALRRLTLIFGAVAGVLAIIFPNALTWVAHLVGVGRGADLLLYGLAVVVFGQLIRARTAENAHLRQITQLARHIAIAEAPEAGAAGAAAVQRRPDSDASPER